MQLSDQLMSQLEAIAEDLEENIDFTDLVDTYFNYADNPVNVNSPELEALLDIYLLTPFQLESLKSYIREFGAILSIYELEFVGGLDDNTIRLIGPLLRFELPQRAQKIKPKNVVRYGRHQVLMRVEQVLEQKQGYLPIDDSALWARLIQGISVVRKNIIPDMLLTIETEYAQVSLWKKIREKFSLPDKWKIPFNDYWATAYARDLTFIQLIFS